MTQQKLIPDAQHPDQKGQLVMRYPIDPFGRRIDLNSRVTTTRPCCGSGEKENPTSDQGKRQ